MMTVPADALYDQDYYAWTQQQAELLRHLPLTGNRIDAENVAEEIEDLGRSELRAAQSLVEHIIEHLLKLEHDPVRLKHSRHWRGNWRIPVG